MYVVMATRTTIYIEEKLLDAYDTHIGLVKRSTAISEMMRNELKKSGVLIE